MPMGIVSDKDFESALNDATPSQNPSPLPSIPSVEIVDMDKGRGKGNVEVPSALRQIIGEESVINGRASALEIANSFGIGPSSVSAYSHGATSTASIDTQPNLTHLNDAKLRVAKKARNRLVMALNSLTQEKIDGAKAKDIAGVAKDMSAIIRNMEPDTPKLNGSSGPTFIFYSPQMRSEKVFDVVRVKE
jgi:predicted transcriptional regulator